jgi:hypothetical protein
MPLTRRSFLLWSFAASLLGQSRRLLAALVSPIDPAMQPLSAAELRCLRVWLDTLLPADEFSPAASTLDVDVRVAGKAGDDPGYLKLLHAGCRWLDRQARTRGAQAFEHLDASGREQVVRLSEQSAEKSLPWVFFGRTRDDAFGFYYARSETWGMLGYPGPPQPRGFMDHARPPQSQGRGKDGL